MLTGGDDHDDGGDDSHDCRNGDGVGDLGDDKDDDDDAHIGDLNCEGRVGWSGDDDHDLRVLSF